MNLSATQPIFRPKPRRLWRRSLVICLFLLLPLLGASLVSAIYWQARTDERTHVDAIVVLGAAQWNGRPSDVLEARLEQTLELWNEGWAPLIIVTGGKMEGDAFTEAETSRNWLADRGVPESAILMEDESRNTWASFEGVDALLQDTDVHTLLIVSDGFHLFRAELMARSFGFEAYSSPAENSPIEPWGGTEFGYVVRESAGVLAALPNMIF